MRSLGLDIGERTIGVAVSDPLGMFAQPVTTIRRVGRVRDVAALVEIIQEREVGTVVAGLPMRTSGEEGPEAVAVRKMMAVLQEERPELRIVYQDERFTTAQAQRTLIAGDVRRKKRKEVVDQVAAVLILQAWLDSGGS